MNANTIIKVYVILLAWIMTLLLVSGVFSDKTMELEARIDRVMPNMIIARDFHHKAIDYPELFRHDPVANNDAGWVRIYTEVISILEEVRD